MIFWTLLIIALSVMIFMYFQWGHLKLWLLVIVYAALAISGAYFVYLIVPDLYLNDLIALYIPYLFLFPLHFGSKYLLKNYVLVDDNKQSKYFVAVYNRILNVLFLVNGFLIFGLLLSILDSIFDSFKAENIWTISLLGTVITALFIIIIIIGNKNKFCYVLIVGPNKVVYKLESSKSRIKVRTVLNTDLVYPRNIIQDNGLVNYLYYVKEDINMNGSKFKKSSSKMLEYIKTGIEKHETIEEKQVEYIEKKSGVNHL